MIARHIYSLNEQSLTIEFGREISPEINNRVMALHHALKTSPFYGFVESVPAYATLTVYFDLVQIKKKKECASISARQYVSDIITRMLENPETNVPSVLPLLQVPVCYDLSLAPDLPWVAEYCRLSIPEIIERHCREIYRVYMIGYIPGFPYLGRLPPELEVPRKLRPSLSVTAGSVALAARQTGIYPFTIPGGWQVIGHTPLNLFDINRDPCCSMTVGQEVQFVPITLEAYHQQKHL